MNGPSDNGEESGLTQFSYMTFQDDVSHFAFPFSLDLQFDINRLDHPDTRDTLPKWPQLCFEVISIGKHYFQIYFQYRYNVKAYYCKK